MNNPQLVKAHKKKYQNLPVNDYKLNTPASDLRRKRLNTIGLIVPWLSR